MDPKSLITSIVKKIEQDLHSIQYPETPENLYEPIAYSLDLGGKRMRPLLVAMVYQMYQEADTLDKVIPLCRCIEVFHNFTLLHDDIMDKAPLRRGKPTVYKKWDENIAILSGDVMLVQAYQYLNELGSDQLSRLLTVFNEGAVKVCEGQQYDMNFEEMETVKVEDYLEMIYLKTAALLDHAVEMAAIYAKAPEDDIQNLKRFAKNVGIAFQLKDDWLDAFGEPEKVGKQPGGDILSNKKTFLLLKAMELANSEQKAKLNHWLSKEDEPGLKVEVVTDVFREIGIPELTQELIQSYFQVGIEALRGLSSTKPEKEVLASYVELLMDREY